MADRASAALTQAQQRKLRALADSLPYEDAATWAKRATERGLPFLASSHGPVPVRRARARRDLCAAVAGAVNNRSIRQRWRAVERNRDRRTLRTLIDVCD